MSFQYSKVKGLVLLTSRNFNGQDPPVSAPVSVSTAFATSNLATFVKDPIYKLTPRRRKERFKRKREIQRSPHHTEGKESCHHHHGSPFLHLIAIAIYL
jgi:hypothetical protein